MHKKQRADYENTFFIIILYRLHSENNYLNLNKTTMLKFIYDCVTYNKFYWKSMHRTICLLMYISYYCKQNFH